MRRLIFERAYLYALQTFLDQAVIEHNGGRLTAETAAEVKLLSSELENDVLDESVQLHGGAGYMEEYRVCRMFTHAFRASLPAAPKS